MFFILWFLFCMLCSAFCVLASVFFIVCSVICILRLLFCTMCSAFCVLCSVFNFLCSLFKVLFSMFFTVLRVLCYCHTRAQLAISTWVEILHGFSLQVGPRSGMIIGLKSTHPTTHPPTPDNLKFGYTTLNQGRRH